MTFFGERRGPFVSIVMPVRNVAGFVDAAIASIVDQTYPYWELVVVDDASSDGTSEIVSGWQSTDRRIRVLHNGAHEGISHSLNAGVAAGRGELVARMDGDDVSMPRRIEAQIRELAEDPNIVVCGTAVELLTVSGDPVGTFSPPSDDDDIRRYLLKDNPFVHSSVIFRRDAFLTAGGYPPNVVYEDYRLWVAMAELGSLRNLPSRLVAHRIRDGSYTMTTGGLKQRVERLRIQARAAREIGPWRESIRPLARSCFAVAAAGVRAIR